MQASVWHLREIAVAADGPHIRAFSYGSELATADVALSTLVRCLESVRLVRTHAIASGPWQKREEWLNRQIALTWRDRGAFPGLGAALEAVGMRLGTALALELRASGMVRPEDNPWTTIDGSHYWDGAIVSNSPLEQVVERCGVAGKRVFIVDLYPSRRRLPTDLMEVMLRRDEIVYSERIRSDVRTRALVRDFHKLVEEILGEVAPDKAVQIRQRPRYIQLMGDLAPLTITRIIREVAEDEAFSKDYDFSRASLERHKEEGYEMTRRALGC